MAGASETTRRITNVNANWVAGAPGEDGTTRVLRVDEDGDRHTVSPSPAAMTAFVAMTRPDTVLLWDSENQTLIVSNLVGEWLPGDWTAARPKT